MSARRRNRARGLVAGFVLAAGVCCALGTATALASFPGYNGRIAFMRDYDIYAMNPDGTGLVNLTRTFNDHNGSGRLNDSPSWSADGTRIVFTRTDRAGYPNVFEMFADGSDAEALTAGENDYQPSWSPDGRHIAFVGQFAGPGIYVMSADGTGQHRVVQPSGSLINFESPVWSPDGTKILFEADTGASCDLYTVNPDGTGETQLTQNASGGCDVFPDWSPDGTKILFTDSQSAQIWTMNADGSSETQVTTTANGAYGARWSPDGSRVVFGSVPAGSGFPALYSMNPDGSGEAQLTSPAACSYFCGDEHPSWQSLVWPWGFPPQ